MTNSKDKKQSPKSKGDSPAIDPAEILRNAIAAAQKPAIRADAQSDRTTKVPENLETPDNVHEHPSLRQSGKPKAVQGYFITDEPPVRRCDPAFGVGFEFL